MLSSLRSFFVTSLVEMNVYDMLILFVFVSSLILTIIFALLLISTKVNKLNSDLQEQSNAQIVSNKAILDNLEVIVSHIKGDENVSSVSDGIIRNSDIRSKIALGNDYEDIKLVENSEDKYLEESKLSSSGIKEDNVEKKEVYLLPNIVDANKNSSEASNKDTPVTINTQHEVVSDSVLFPNRAPNYKMPSMALSMIRDEDSRNSSDNDNSPVNVLPTNVQPSYNNFPQGNAQFQQDVNANPLVNLPNGTQPSYNNFLQGNGQFQQDVNANPLVNLPNGTQPSYNNFLQGNGQFQQDVNANPLVNLPNGTQPSYNNFPQGNGQFQQDVNANPLVNLPNGTQPSYNNFPQGNAQFQQDVNANPLVNLPNGTQPSYNNFLQGNGQFQQDVNANPLVNLPNGTQPSYNNFPQGNAQFQQDVNTFNSSIEDEENNVSHSVSTPYSDIFGSNVSNFDSDNAVNFNKDSSVDNLYNYPQVKNTSVSSASKVEELRSRLKLAKEAVFPIRQSAKEVFKHTQEAAKLNKVPIFDMRPSLGFVSPEVDTQVASNDRFSHTDIPSVPKFNLANMNQRDVAKISSPSRIFGQSSVSPVRGVGATNLANSISNKNLGASQYQFFDRLEQERKNRLQGRERVLSASPITRDNRLQGRERVLSASPITRDNRLQGRERVLSASPITRDNRLQGRERVLSASPITRDNRLQGRERVLSASPITRDNRLQGRERVLSASPITRDNRLQGRERVLSASPITRDNRLQGRERVLSASPITRDNRLQGRERVLSASPITRDNRLQGRERVLSASPITRDNRLQGRERVLSASPITRDNRSQGRLSNNSPRGDNLRSTRLLPNRGAETNNIRGVQNPLRSGSVNNRANLSSRLPVTNPDRLLPRADRVSGRAERAPSSSLVDRRRS